MIAIRSTLCAIVGLIVGIFVHQKLIPQFGAGLPNLFQVKNYIFSSGDAIVIVIGVLLFAFGSRVHVALKWFGLGFLLGALAMEIMEYIQYGSE